MNTRYSKPMWIIELTRADRITGRSDGRRNLKTERSAMRRRLRKREQQGEIEKIGRGLWRAIYRSGTNPV